MKILDKNLKRKYNFSNYDPMWISKFEGIKAFIEGVWQSAISIEHIGSTSVPGMKAKPIIDVLITVDKMYDFSSEKQKMENAGYEWGENYIAPNSLIFYRLGEGDEKIENIHVVEKGSAKEKQFMTMRDYLRSHPDKVKEYSDLKDKNRKLYPDDYPAYREAKRPFLENLEQEAYRWSEANS